MHFLGNLSLKNIYIFLVKYLILFIELFMCKYTNNISNITACIDLNSSHTTNFAEIVDVVSGSVVHLWCRYCEEPEEIHPKLWYFRTRDNVSLKEIEFNNYELTKISITPFHNLNINNFQFNDSGVYVCKNVELKLKSKKIIYVVDAILNEAISVKRGMINQWHDYKRDYLDPINTRFKKLTEKPFLTLSKYSGNYTFKLVTAWDTWSRCKAFDNYLKGKRKKTGRCRFHIEMANNSSKHDVSTNMFEYDYSCRSLQLNTIFPQISQVIRTIPEYEVSEQCIVQQKSGNNGNNCLKTVKQVAENSHLMLVCSDIYQESDIKWYKNKKLLNSTFRNNLGKSIEEPHVSIDLYNSLHILHITKDEEGNYSCSVDGKKIEQFEVKVVSKRKMLNQEFIRYSIYLGFVLSLTVTCYCAGICVAWHRKASFADPLNLNRITSTGFCNERERLLH